MLEEYNNNIEIHVHYEVLLSPTGYPSELYSKIEVLCVFHTRSGITMFTSVTWVKTIYVKAMLPFIQKE